MLHRNDSTAIAPETEGEGEKPPRDKDGAACLVGSNGPREASGVPQGSTPSLELQLGEGNAGLATPLRERFGVREDDQAGADARGSKRPSQRNGEGLGTTEGSTPQHEGHSRERCAHAPG